MSQNKNGFTLVEITIAATIVALLGVALLFGIKPITQIFKGYDLVRKSDLAKLKAAFEAYYEDNGCYPTFTIKGKPGVYTQTYTCGSNALAPYIDSMPCDPNTNLPYTIYESLNVTAEKNCPTQFGIYAELTNVFDPEGDVIPYCDDTYVVSNPEAKTSFIMAGCTTQKICGRYYGCIEGNCVIVAEDTLPICSPNWCETSVNDCNNNCGNPDYECVNQL